MLPRRAGAEVRADHEGRVATELIAKRRIEPLEQVLGHHGDGGDVQVRTRIEHVRVDIVLADHHCPATEAPVAPPGSSGSMISPATAAAGATQALARWTPASLEP